MFSIASPLNLKFDDIYDAIRKHDMAGALLAARDLRRPHCMEPLLKNFKNEFTSNSYRSEGNAAYARGDYQDALILYNKALLYAPKYSKAMKLVYSNRSALLFKAKYYSACLKDVDTCFAMGCPAEVVDKLKMRKEEALEHTLEEKLANNFRQRSLAFAEKLIKPQTSNPDIPCASLDIKVVLDSNGPKIVAARDIEVGTTIAFEDAFVSSTHLDNNFYSCYYCHKMSLNLIPCDGCCYALFCNESCKLKCMQETHNYLCPIIDICNTKEPDCILAIKTLVKLRQTMSWKDIIAIASDASSYDHGVISNLTSRDDIHFVVGRFFNHSMNNSVLIHYLETETDFFPSTPDVRADAILAASKIIMDISIYAITTVLSVVVNVNSVQSGRFKTNMHGVPNYGLFSFIGKLKKSCLSNVSSVGINREIALVSVTPIKKDTEITMNHFSDFWLEEEWRKYKSPKRMFLLEKTICTCVICSNDWPRQTLNKTQAKKFNEIDKNALQRDCAPDDFYYMFQKICGTMKALSDAPYSKEYSAVYAIFRRSILHFQSALASNFLVCLFNNE